MTASKKMTAQEVADEKSAKIMEGVAAWGAFYRANPQRFALDYLNIHLKLFQKILIYAMVHNYYVLYLAARGQGFEKITIVERYRKDKNE